MVNSLLNINKFTVVVHLYKVSSYN